MAPELEFDAGGQIVLVAGRAAVDVTVWTNALEYRVVEFGADGTPVGQTNDPGAIEATGGDIANVPAPGRRSDLVELLDVDAGTKTSRAAPG